MNGQKAFRLTAWIALLGMLAIFAGPVLTQGLARMKADTGRLWPQQTAEWQTHHAQQAHHAQHSHHSGSHKAGSLHGDARQDGQGAPAPDEEHIHAHCGYCTLLSQTPPCLERQPALWFQTLLSSRSPNPGTQAGFSGPARFPNAWVRAPPSFPPLA